MTSTNDQGRVQEVLARSAVDSEFRAGLLTDPRATLEKAAGRQMPENLRVKFIEKLHDYAAKYLTVRELRGYREKESHGVSHAHDWGRAAVQAPGAFACSFFFTWRSSS